MGIHRIFLLAVELRTRLGRALQLPLPATLLFDHPDLERLEQHLLSLLPGADTTTTATEGSVGDVGALQRALAAQVRLMEERR